MSERWERKEERNWREGEVGEREGRREEREARQINIPVGINYDKRHPKY